MQELRLNPSWKGIVGIAGKVWVAGDYRSQLCGKRPWTVLYNQSQFQSAHWPTQAMTKSQLIRGAHDASAQTCARKGSGCWWPEGRHLNNVMEASFFTSPLIWVTPKVSPFLEAKRWIRLCGKSWHCGMMKKVSPGHSNSFFYIQWLLVRKLHSCLCNLRTLTAQKFDRKAVSFFISV